MSSVKHFPGTVCSVAADDTGHPICALCDAHFPATDASLLLRRPGTGHWDAWCHSCTRRFAHRFVDLHIERDLLALFEEQEP